MRDTNKRMRITGALCLLFGFSAAALAGDLPCPGNLNDDDEVGPFDLALLLGAWGACADPCTPGDPDGTCAPDFDGDCAVGPFDLAIVLGTWGPCPGPPVNDDCEGAIEIFDGDTDFDTTGATTGGPSHPGCGFASGLPRLDVWYTYNASCTGLLKVCTCNQAFFDTTLVLYEGCDCPATQSQFLACNDDVDICFNNTSRMVAAVEAGVCYKIRLGGYLDTPGFEEEGPGTLTVTCLEGQDSTCCLGNDEPEPGCDDQACENLICSFDPFCCAFPPFEDNGFWDETCEQEALQWCAICAGGGC